MKGETDEPWRSGSNLPEWSTWVAMSSSSVKTRTKRSSFTDHEPQCGYKCKEDGDLRRMIKKKIFKFADYDLIGFNLDHTVVSYDFNSLVKAQYHFLVEYLITKKLYPPECFGKITDADINFLCRGTFIDTANGNFLKVDNTGQIIRATNGTRPLSPQEIQKIYGKKKQFRPLSDYVTNLMKNYKLTSSPKLDCYTDYYQSAGILIYIKTVDFCRNHKLKKKLKLKTLWMDIDEGLNAMADKGNREYEWDILMPTYKLRTDPRLALWLAELRKSSSLMLITSCTPYAADLRMTTAFSPKWRELFDFIVYNVDRFLFFRESANFCDLEGRLVPFTGEGEYVKGSIDAIDTYLKRELNRVPKIVYAGGASLHDILAPRCDVLGLIAELTEHPYFVGLVKLENAAWILSKIWGQLDSDEDLLTIWGRALEEKTKFCAPTLDYFTHQTTAREFHPHWLETVDTFAIKELVKERMRVSRTSRAYLDPKNDEETKKMKERQSTNALPKDVNQSNRNAPIDSLQSESQQKLIAEPKEKSKGQGSSTKKTQSTADELDPNTLETPSVKLRDVFNRSKFPELKEKHKGQGTSGLTREANPSRRNAPIDNFESDSKQRLIAELKEKPKSQATSDIQKMQSTADEPEQNTSGTPPTKPRDVISRSKLPERDKGATDDLKEDGERTKRGWW